jgi:5-methylcytosine-specific restriction endonuclease McrA
MPYKRIDLSRKNILKRDNHRCQYCGKKTLDITIDHIMPKSRGGIDTWDNLVAACVRCNNRKGNRTPDEAGMKLLSKPRRPNHIMFLKQYIGRTEDSWRPFLFMD